MELLIAHCRSVYHYWRLQGFSPDDARTQVGAYVFTVLDPKHK